MQRLEVWLWVTLWPSIDPWPLFHTACSAQPSGWHTLVRVTLNKKSGWYVAGMIYTSGSSGGLLPGQDVISCMLSIWFWLCSIVFSLTFRSQSGKLCAQKCTSARDTIWPDSPSPAQVPGWEQFSARFTYLAKTALPVPDQHFFLDSARYTACLTALSPAAVLALHYGEFFRTLLG